MKEQLVDKGMADLFESINFENMEVLPIITVDDEVGNCYDCDDGTGGECDSCDCDSCDASS